MRIIRIVQHFRRNDPEFKNENWLDVIVDGRAAFLTQQYIPSDGRFYDELHGFLNAFKFMNEPYEIQWEQISDMDNNYPLGR